MAFAGSFEHTKRNAVVSRRRNKFWFPFVHRSSWYMKSCQKCLIRAREKKGNTETAKQADMLNTDSGDDKWRVIQVAICRSRKEEKKKDSLFSLSITEPKGQQVMQNRVRSERQAVAILYADDVILLNMSHIHQQKENTHRSFLFFDFPPSQGEKT